MGVRRGGGSHQWTGLFYPSADIPLISLSDVSQFMHSVEHSGALLLGDAQLCGAARCRQPRLGMCSVHVAEISDTPIYFTCACIRVYVISGCRGALQ